MSRIHQMRGAVYWSAGALLCLNCLPHTVPSIVRKSVELEGVRPPEELVNHVHKIAAAMQLPQPHKIHVFISRGFASLSAGSTLLPGGAVVGLPRTVLFKNKKDVGLSGVTVKGDPIDLESEVGERVAKLFLPSSQQINFSIAHEVAHLQQIDPLYQVFLSPLTLVLGYHVGRSVPKYLFPHHTTAAFSFILALSLVAYAQISASISRWQEHRADRTAALCHRSYGYGGIETMEKWMQLDSIFRKPSKGYSLESLTSSLNKHPPFSERLDRLEDLLTHTT